MLLETALIIDKDYETHLKGLKLNENGKATFDIQNIESLVKFKNKASNDVDELFKKIQADYVVNLQDAVDFTINDIFDRANSQLKHTSNDEIIINLDNVMLEGIVYRVFNTGGKSDFERYEEMAKDIKNKIYQRANEDFYV